jgi:hypothetical protein
MASQNIFYSVFLWLAEHWYVVKTHKTFLNLRNVLEMMLFFLKSIQNLWNNNLDKNENLRLENTGGFC